MDQWLERKCILLTCVFKIPVILPKRPDELKIEYPMPMYIDLFFSFEIELRYTANPT